MHLVEFALFAGLSWTLPAGWQSRTEPPPLRCPAPPGPVAASGGTVVMVGSTEDIAPRDLARLPERPRPFRLPPDQQFECLGPGAVLGWQTQDRALSAWVRGGQQRRVEVEALLDSLVVERVPPPPPARWRTASSGTADSIRVPPGWSVRALQVQRGVARPRVLYRLANRDGSVILRVREARRGPVSPAFGRGPLVFDARHRAGLGFRGYRVSFRVFARAGASASVRDVAWAEVAARSAGFSPVGRE